MDCWPELLAKLCLNLVFVATLCLIPRAAITDAVRKTKSLQWPHYASRGQIMLETARTPRGFGAKAKTKPGLMPGFCFNLSQSEGCFVLVKAQELLAKFDLGGSLAALILRRLGDGGDVGVAAEVVAQRAAEDAHAGAVDDADAR